MNKVKLLIFSISPLIIGRMITYAILNFNWYGTILSIISILFCVYWFFVGYKSYDYVKTKKESILLGNSFNILSIILFLFQAFVLKRFIFNILGYSPQQFYLPMLRVSMWVEDILLFFTPNSYFTFITIISFVLMMVIYYWGLSTRIKNEKSNW